MPAATNGAGAQFLYGPEIIGKDFELSDINALAPLTGLIRTS